LETQRYRPLVAHNFIIAQLPRGMVRAKVIKRRLWVVEDKVTMFPPRGMRNINGIRVCKGLLCDSRGWTQLYGDNFSLDAGRRGGITDFSRRQQSTEYGIVRQTVKKAHSHKAPKYMIRGKCKRKENTSSSELFPPFPVLGMGCTGTPPKTNTPSTQ
jgi:hypothetical protein